MRILSLWPLSWPSRSLRTDGQPSRSVAGRLRSWSVDSRSPVVRGDDGKDHVEYELLVVNAVEQPVTLTSLTVLDPAAKELTGSTAVLVAATQTLLDKKPVRRSPRRGVSVDVDLIVPPGTAPERVTHRLAYSVRGHIDCGVRGPARDRRPEVRSIAAPPP